jgi:hypothetical protein
MHSHVRPLFTAGLLLSCTVPAAAQESLYPVYKCGDSTYSQAPCDGGQVLGTRRVSKTFEPPPASQDRARQMARAQLAPEVRQQCVALEAAIRSEESRLRSRGQPPSEAEEGDLAIQRVRYREMRC